MIFESLKTFLTLIIERKVNRNRNTRPDESIPDDLLTSFIERIDYKLAHMNILESTLNGAISNYVNMSVEYKTEGLMILDKYDMSVIEEALDERGRALLNVLSR